MLKIWNLPITFIDNVSEGGYPYLIQSIQKTAPAKNLFEGVEENMFGVDRGWRHGNKLMGDI